VQVPDRQSRRAVLALSAAAALMSGAVRGQVDTTLEDFFLSGTQPDESGGAAFHEIVDSTQCGYCHEIIDPQEVVIFSRWAGSIKANAGRDPVFKAALAVANQDAAFVGDLCLRCHAPAGWLAGRSDPPDGSSLFPSDLDGVNCNFCHRMVDPVLRPGISPPEDEPILAALAKAGALPTQYGNGSYVVQAEDVRRGPLDDVPANYHGVPIIPSEFHKSSDLCGTCHDVSNPAYTKQPDGSYALNTSDLEHDSLDKYEMFPIERTYSEWANSMYATTGVDAGGRFGGDRDSTVVSTCQDCHMPSSTGYISGYDGDPFFERTDIPSHDFNGGNAWVLDMVANLYAGVQGVYPWYFDQSKARTVRMLENAATLELLEAPCGLRVRVVNETGHKLPTGYPEGRRMWLEVAFLNDALATVYTHGAYDGMEAELTVEDTKVYESKLGVDQAVSDATGVPVGPSFHFALNNVVYKDNRIPPRGFTNAAFAVVQAAPVGAEYADGQYWDDTMFHVPEGSVRAVVRLYYQTSSKEYVTFLRDENHTTGDGRTLYEQWELTGKSAPVLMAEATIGALAPNATFDADCDGMISRADYASLADCLGNDGETLHLGCEPHDADRDGDVDLRDVAAYQIAY